MHFLIVKFVAAVLTLAVSAEATDTYAAANTTANSAYLRTWWHNTGEVNYQTPVKNANVRQSHIYSTWVKSTSDASNT
jgi:hypothetical protein